MHNALVHVDCWIWQNNLSFFSGTKNYNLKIGDTATGPWHMIAEGQLHDPRQSSSVEKTEIVIASPRGGRFVRFRCTSWWGNGCALQYLGFTTDSVPGELPLKVLTKIPNRNRLCSCNLSTNYFVQPAMLFCYWLRCLGWTNIETNTALA